MKSTTVAAAAAALVGGAHANHAHAHAHQNLFAKRASDSCGCTTEYATITGSGWLFAPTVVAEAPATVPTPIATTCPTTGVYDFPASTITVTETTTVCGASAAALTSAGVWTLGGVTTVVDHSTVVVCPYATTETQNGEITSVVKQTTYVCPEAGTYTIAPHTTSVSKPCTVLVPDVTSYGPGTYTAPAAKVTVTEEEFVYYCPYSSAAWSTSVALATATPSPVKASSPAPKSTGSPKNNSSSPALGGSDHRWGITLSPYDDSGNCKTADTIMSQMAQIAAKNLKSVRVYSTDCNTLENYGAAARANGLKLIVGVYVSETGCANSSPDVESQIAALEAWKDYDLVELVVVTNEAIFNHWCSVDQVVSLITETKTRLRAAGWTCPFTTTDTVGTWTGTSGIEALCSVMDVIACNAYAFFNAATVPSTAGAFVAGQLALVEAVCPGLDAYVLESGWPSSTCQCYGDACGSADNQAEAISGILSAVGNNVVLLSAFDEMWKAPGPYCAEQNWGCLDNVPSS